MSERQPECGMRNARRSSAFTEQVTMKLVSRKRHVAHFAEKRVQVINDVWINDYIYHLILLFTERQNESNANKCANVCFVRQ